VGWATPDQIGAVQPITGLEDKVEELQRRAEILIRQAVPDLDWRLATGTLTIGLLGVIEAAMVERVLRNPLGLRQESRQSDDFTHSWTVDQAISAGALYLDPSELDLLIPSALSRLPRSARLRTPLRDC
jgi:hypothetical protein